MLYIEYTREVVSVGGLFALSVACRPIGDVARLAAGVRLVADSVAKVESCNATNFWRELEAQTDGRFV